MRNLLFVVLSLSLLSSCELMKKELKKANTIRKSAQKVCDCSYVSVSTNNKNGHKTVELTINNTSAPDLSSNANAIMKQLSEDYPAICNFDDVTIDYGNESYSFQGCQDVDSVASDSLELATEN